MHVGEKMLTSHHAVQEGPVLDRKAVLLDQASHVSTAGMTHSQEKVELETL